MSGIGTKDIEIAEEVRAQELILTANDFWWWAPHYVRTEDEENEIVRLYPTKEAFPYLYKFSNILDENQLVCVLKSRRLLITWTVILKFFHKAQFAGTGIPGTSDAFRAAILSVDEEAVKDNIRHLTDVYERFPDWLKQLNPLNTKNKMELEFKHGGAIKGFSLKQSGPRTYGFSAMLFDEMAFQAFARSTWTGAKPTLGKMGKMIAVSTPNGKGNFFYRLFSNPYKEFEGVCRVKIPWWANPEHDKEWFKLVTSGMESQDISREYQMSFTTAAGRPVFRGLFDEKAHILTGENDPPEYIPGRPVLQWWDMGYHYPACGFGQMNAQDQLVVHYSTTGSDEEIAKFGQRLKDIRSTYFPPTARFIHFVPPDAWKRYTAQSTHGHTSDYDTLFNHKTGIYAREMAYRGAMETAKRLNSVRKLLKLRDDGRPSLVMSQKGCPDLIDGMLGGYCYPEEDKIAKNPEAGEIPEKNEYSHEADGLQMVATGYDIIQYMEKAAHKKEDDTDDFIAKRTGYRIGA